MPGANVIAAEYEPVIGAVLMGLKRMNRVLAGGIYRNIEEGAARFPVRRLENIYGKRRKEMKAKKSIGVCISGNNDRSISWVRQYRRHCGKKRQIQTRKRAARNQGKISTSHSGISGRTLRWERL